MVSSEAVILSLNDKKMRVSETISQDSSNKRKLQDWCQGKNMNQNSLLYKRSVSENSRSLVGFELQLQTPLPLERQGCLDIENMKKPEDPRSNPKKAYMSLDLELKLLPRDVSPPSKENADEQSSNHEDSCESSNNLSMDSSKNIQKGDDLLRIGIKRCPSWLAFDADDDDDGDGDRKKNQEMVATVCMRCHMLVMLCKAVPMCPNCKFMHPQDHGSKNLFKPSSSSILSLLC